MDMLELGEDVYDHEEELEELRAKTAASISFKLWLEDMEETAEPIEWTVYGTARDIGRMNARLGYLNKAAGEPV